MRIPEAFEFGPSGSLARAPAEDVPLVPHVEEADLGWVGETARTEANSLLMTASAQGNKLADMPDWMVGAIGALHVNIGREHWIGSWEDKTSPGFHDSPVSSSQGDLESIALEPPRTGLGRHIGGDFGSFRLWYYHTVLELSETFKTNDQIDFYSEDKKGWVTDRNFTI